MSSFIKRPSLSDIRHQKPWNINDVVNSFNPELAELIAEIKAIQVEAEFNIRWGLIEMYHNIGEAIASCHDVNLQILSQATTISERNLQRAVQFYTKFPDLALLPEGKNISWYALVNKYLPKHKEPTLTLVKLFTSKPDEILRLCKNCYKRNLDSMLLE